MNDIAFVETLEISREAGLRGLGAVLPERHAGVVRGPGGVAAPDASEVIDGRMRAAVNGGSVVSFVAGLEADEKRDVVYSTQLAQRAASAQHDRHAATALWYRAYIEVLERLGWIAEGFAFTRRGASFGEFRMDRSALDVVATIATGNQLAILVRALDALKGLADDSGSVRVFEFQSLAELSGNFQLGTVERGDNGALAMAIGGFYFTMTDRRRRALFWNWGSEEIEFWAGAQKMTLNRTHYGKVRAAVAQKLAEDALDYIVDLPVR